MLSLIIFVFMSASVALASAQLMHAKAAHAQYNKFLANMAAEAGVYAAFDATLSITPRVALDSGNGRLVQYEAQISGATQPFSIQSTGSVTVDGFTYLSVVTATVSNGVIAQWSYGP
ncbi:MAG TPA: hypothetical protein V6D00_07590 [Pantanalinema sp.]